MTGQEALAAIKEMKESAHWYRGDHRMAAAIRVIENLVERTTPIKLYIPKNELGYGVCKCSRIIGLSENDKYKFCPDCDQAIDYIQMIEPEATNEQPKQ